MATLNELKDLINSLSPAEKQELVGFLSNSCSSSPDHMAKFQESRFSQGLSCPKCGCSSDIVRNGMYNGKQRFLCRNCKSTFMWTQSTILHRTHKSIETWQSYLDCMANGMTIRQSARVCNISIPTAFYWRHKLLDAMRSKLNNSDNKLSGIVESDETYFRVSYKGQRKGLPRESRKRGGQASKRGLSNEQACVVCGLDRQGNIRSKASNLGKISAKDLSRVYIGKVKDNTIFCTDSEKSYRKFTKAHGFGLIQLERGKHKRGIYHINHVNSYHSLLKDFIRKFKGVATKYLDNYLAWNQVKGNCLGSQFKELASQSVHIRNVEIKNRPLIS